MALPAAKQKSQEIVKLMTYEYDYNDNLKKFERPSLEVWVGLDGSHFVELSDRTNARCTPDGRVWVEGDADVQDELPGVPPVPVLEPLSSMTIGLAVLYMITMQNEKKRELKKKKPQDGGLDFGDPSDGLKY